MNFKSVLSLLFVCLACCYCKTYTPDQLPEKQLIFGSGGGFAGIETTYTLLENGQLFKHSSVDTLIQELEKTNKSTVKSFFETLDNMAFDTIQLNTPGNVYQFIQLQDVESSNKVVWDPAVTSNDSFSVKLNALYKELITIASPVKPAN